MCNQLRNKASSLMNTHLKEGKLVKKFDLKETALCVSDFHTIFFVNVVNVLVFWLWKVYFCVDSALQPGPLQ